MKLRLYSQRKNPKK